MHASETPFPSGFCIQLSFKRQLPWREICKAECGEGCVSAAYAVSADRQAGETLTCWEQMRGAGSCLRDCED